MLGAKPAVVRAASIRFNAKRDWNLSRQTVICAIKPLCIAADKVFAHSVCGTCLAEVDSFEPGNDLCRNQCQAVRTQTLCHTEKCVVAIGCHDNLVHVAKRVITCGKGTAFSVRITSMSLLPPQRGRRWPTGRMRGLCGSKFHSHSADGSRSKKFKFFMHIDDIQICGGTTLLFHRSDDIEESPDCKNKSGNGSDTSDQNDQHKYKFVVQTLS